MPDWEDYLHDKIEKEALVAKGLLSAEEADRDDEGPYLDMRTGACGEGDREDTAAFLDEMPEDNTPALPDIRLEGADLNAFKTAMKRAQPGSKILLPTGQFLLIGEALSKKEISARAAALAKKLKPTPPQE